jgi:hypothetical protein
LGSGPPTERENIVVLQAVDSAGNVSAPSNEFPITLDDCM